MPFFEAVGAAGSGLTLPPFPLSQRDELKASVSQNSALAKYADADDEAAKAALFGRGRPCCTALVSCAWA